MCGIAGAIWTAPEKAVSTRQLEAMTKVLAHRGPDDSASYLDSYQARPPYAAQPGVALGFRRLAIIDLATGRQPMSNEDGTVWVVFNGEIYNYRELRQRLEGAGHVFRTQSDTETLVHLYEDEGLDCFSHLNGMFAVAIWDQPRGRLVLGRDRLGQKPLVYRHEPGRLSFASELKSLLQLPAAPRTLDPNAVDEYLTYQYVPYPNTIFREYRKLPPGHRLVYCDDRIDVEPYWELPVDERPVDQQQAAEQLRELLSTAVGLRMRSDVPLGAFLSGGVDSSLIVAAMQRHSSRPVQTFSIGFSVAEYDESRQAREVAAALGTEHHEFHVQPDAVEMLPRLAALFDEPFGDSSAIPTWYVSQLTRQEVTVALSGDGGDELFAGYPRYRAVALARRLDRWPLLRRLLAAGWIQRIPAGSRQKSRIRQFKRFCEALQQPPLRRYLDWIAIFREAQRAVLYQDQLLEQLGEADPAEFLNRHWRRLAARDPLTVTSLADLPTYLTGDLMHKVDMTSMAHSLECRQPFLDYRLVEFACRLPSRLKFRSGRGKRLLRTACGDWLPATVWRRRKMGFGVPLDHWFRGPLRGLLHDLLLPPDARCHQLLRPQAIRQLVDEHLQHRRDHSQRLWALIMLELWFRQWAVS